MNSIEEANAYQAMMEKLELTQDQLAKRIGKSRSYIANTFKIIAIAGNDSKLCLEGKLTMGQVRAFNNFTQKKKLESLA